MTSCSSFLQPLGAGSLDSPLYHKTSELEKPSSLIGFSSLPLPFPARTEEPAEAQGGK